MIFLAAIFLVYWLFYGSKQYIYSSGFVERVNSIANFKYGSMAIRLGMYIAGLDAFSKNPILGYGPESQEKIFIQYYRKDPMVLDEVNILADRAHNEMLDILLTAGVLGLFSFIIILVLLIFKGLKFIKEEDGNSPVALFILLSIIINFPF